MARSDLKETISDITTLGGVIEEILKIKTDGGLIDRQSDLYGALEKIYKALGDVSNLNPEKVEEIEKQLLRWKDELSLREEEKWLETKVDDLEAKTPESKSLNPIKLAQLLDEQKKEMERRADWEITAQSLAEKYKVEKSQVEEWLERISQIEEQARQRGFDEKTARSVAERAVIRQERITDEIAVVSKVDRQRAKAVAKTIVDETIVSEERITKREKLKQIVKPVEAKKGLVLEMVKQSERLAREIEVVKNIEAETRVFMGGLEENLVLSQPTISFERHGEEIERLTKEALESVWSGKKDNLISTEVVIEKDGRKTRVEFTETVKSILETEDGAIDVALKEASGKVTADIASNVELATNFEFVSRSEAVADEIFLHNPEISRSVVNNYSESVVEASMPILAPGQRTSRQTSGEYGLNEEAYVQTNVLVRFVSGLSDYRRTKQVVSEAETAGIDTQLQVLSPEGRQVSSVLSQLRRNPLLERGMTSLRGQVTRRILSNSRVIGGVGNFVGNNLGFSSIFGVETATALPTVMGYFAGGGTFSGAMTGIMNAGGVTGWINGMMAGGVVTGKVAAGVGATAAAGTAAAGAGATVAGTGVLTAAQAIPVVGQILAVVAGVIAIAKPIIKKLSSFLKDKLGIDLKKFNLGLKVKKFLSEDLGLGNFIGGLGKFAISLGSALVVMPGMIVAIAFQWVIIMISWLVPAIIGGLVIYMLFFVNPQASTMAPTQNMIGGGQDAGNFDPNADPLRADDIVGECSVASHTSVEIKQNVGPWATKRLPKGCTIADSGCGPTSVSIILRAKNSSLTPDVLVSRSEYSSAGCPGTSISQNKAALENELGGGVRVDGACSINSIARSICDGNKIVMILANFYQTNRDLSKIGGHYVVAVGVKDGQIVTKDPFYSDNTPFLLEGEPVHAGAIHNIKSCIIIDADRI